MLPIYNRDQTRFEKCSRNDGPCLLFRSKGSGNIPPADGSLPDKIPRARFGASYRADPGGLPAQTIPTLNWEDARGLDNNFPAFFHSSRPK